MKSQTLTYGNLMCAMGAMLAMGHHPWDLMGLGAGAVWFPFMIRSYIKGDPVEEARRKRELSRQRIRELEKDLGYESLRLEDLDQLFEEDTRNKKEK